MLKRYKNADPLTKMTVKYCSVQAAIIAASITVIVVKALNNDSTEA